MRNIKKLITSLLIVVMSITATMPVFAKDIVGYGYYAKTKKNTYFRTYGADQDYAMMSVKKPEDIFFLPLQNYKFNYSNTNKNVASLVKGKNYYVLKLNNYGATTINVKLKAAKAYSNVRAYVHYAAYQNPCKSFKFGNKEYATKFNADPVGTIGMKKGSKTGKINIQAKNGWTLFKIYMVTNDKNHHNTGKQIKNGSKITVNGYKNNSAVKNTKNYAIRAVFKNNKSGFVSSVVLFTGGIQNFA